MTTKKKKLTFQDHMEAAIEILRSGIGKDIAVAEVRAKEARRALNMLVEAKDIVIQLALEWELDRQLAEEHNRAA